MLLKTKHVRLTGLSSIAVTSLSPIFTHGKTKQARRALIEIDNRRMKYVFEIVRTSQFDYLRGQKRNAQIFFLTFGDHSTVVLGRIVRTHYQELKFGIRRIARYRNLVGFFDQSTQVVFIVTGHFVPAKSKFQLDITDQCEK